MEKVNVYICEFGRAYSITNGPNGPSHSAALIWLKNLMVMPLYNSGAAPSGFG